MHCAPRAPNVDLLEALHRRTVRHAVLTSARLALDGIVQGTVDLAVAVDISADNMNGLVQALSEQGYQFVRQASPSEHAGAMEVTMLTFTRRDGGNVHVVLVPPALWREAGQQLVWRGFDVVPVPVLRWEVLLRREVDPTALSRDATVIQLPRPSMRLVQDAEALN